MDLMGCDNQCNVNADIVCVYCIKHNNVENMNQMTFRL